MQVGVRTCWFGSVRNRPNADCEQVDPHLKRKEKVNFIGKSGLSFIVAQTGAVPDV